MLEQLAFLTFAMMLLVADLAGRLAELGAVVSRT